jgi:hypothetical protein
MTIFASTKTPNTGDFTVIVQFDNLNTTSSPFALKAGSYTVTVSGGGIGAITLEQRGDGGIFEPTADEPFPAGQANRRMGVMLGDGTYRFAVEGASHVNISVIEG